MGSACIIAEIEPFLVSLISGLIDQSLKVATSLSVA